MKNYKNIACLDRFCECRYSFNPLQPGVAFLYRLKTSENFLVKKLDFFTKFYKEVVSFVAL